MEITAFDEFYMKEFDNLGRAMIEPIGFGLCGITN